jgi:hypothetical protein
VETCKFIGELVYRLRNEAGATVELLTRNEVKKWVFDRFPEVCVARIQQKIVKRGHKVASGEYRSPSFVYVDDKMVMEAMKVLYGISLPPPGKSYMYGLKDHSWQALGAASLYKSRRHQFVT